MTGELFSWYSLFCSEIRTTYISARATEFLSPSPADSPNPRCDKGGGREGDQRRVPGIVIPDPAVPLQVEDAEERDAQAEEQQGAANEKPAVETKTMSGLMALSKSADTTEVFTDCLKLYFCERISCNGNTGTHSVSIPELRKSPSPGRRGEKG